MPRSLASAHIVPIAGMAAALALGACSTTTYGTGTTAASQTMKDVTGILAIGGSKSDTPPIDYSPRAPIVEPPVAGLPPPGSSTAVASAGDWPVDPDEERKRIEALIKEANESGETLKFTVPDIERPPKEPASSRAKRKDSSSLAALDRAQSTEVDPEAAKLFADARKAKTASFDQYGNPVRQYLTEPPAEYRLPDSESPVEITEKPKKNNFSWSDWWPF